MITTITNIHNYMVITTLQSSGIGRINGVLGDHNITYGGTGIFLGKNLEYDSQNETLSGECLLAIFFPKNQPDYQT